MQQPLIRCPIRCHWVDQDPLYIHYHDTEWGVAVRDDRRHFEMLVLEGAQAGLSWKTVLKRRQGYARAFCQFDPHQVAQMTDSDLEALVKDPGIIRHAGKIASVRQNARVFVQIQREFGSFNEYVWSYVGGISLQNHLASGCAIASSPQAEALSKDLRRRGMSFVGPTIIYAYMQAVGLVNDHTVDCFRCQQLQPSQGAGSP